MASVGRNFSQGGHGQRCLQVGQDVVRGAQVYGKAVSGGFGGFDVDIARFENAGLGIHVDLGSAGGDVDRTLRVDVPAVLLERDVETVVVDVCPGQSREEFTPHADIEPVVHQRERVAESRFGIGTRRGSETVDVALLAEFDELEERTGQVGVLVDPQVEVERPEILVILGESAESDDVDTGADPQQVIGFEVSQRFVRRYGAVEQRHQLAVAGVKDVVEGEVAAYVDIHAAQYGDVHIAAQRRESGVELRSESRTLHEISRGILRSGAGRKERRRDEGV